MVRILIYLIFIFFQGLAFGKLSLGDKKHHWPLIVQNFIHYDLINRGERNLCRNLSPAVGKEAGKQLMNNLGLFNQIVANNCKIPCKWIETKGLRAETSALLTSLCMMRKGKSQLKRRKTLRVDHPMCKSFCHDIENLKPAQLAKSVYKNDKKWNQCKDYCKGEQGCENRCLKSYIQRIKNRCSDLFKKGRPEKIIQKFVSGATIDNCCASGDKGACENNILKYADSNWSSHCNDFCTRVMGFNAGLNYINPKNSIARVSLKAKKGYPFKGLRYYRSKSNYCYYRFFDKEGILKLKPGDFLSYMSRTPSGCGEHSVIFLGWVNKARGVARLIGKNGTHYPPQIYTSKLKACAQFKEDSFKIPLSRGHKFQFCVTRIRRPDKMSPALCKYLDSGPRSE